MRDKGEIRQCVVRRVQMHQSEREFGAIISSAPVKVSERPINNDSDENWTIHAVTSCMREQELVCKQGCRVDEPVNGRAKHYDSN